MSCLKTLSLLGIMAQLSFNIFFLFFCLT
jgi:hypothetical protein